MGDNNTFGFWFIDSNGMLASDMISSPVTGKTPFGFTFDSDSHLLVAEVNTQSVSSYDILADGTLQVITPSITNGQRLCCWIVTDGRYVYTSNWGSSSLSLYEVDSYGRLQLIKKVVAKSKSPTDMELSPDGAFLYVLISRYGNSSKFPQRSIWRFIPITTSFLPTERKRVKELPRYAQGLVVI